MVMKNKGGQVTIFIIIGIIVVVSSILVYTFYPDIQSNLGMGESTPQSYIQGCIEDDLREIVDIASNQGGSVNPVLVQKYRGENIEYLCYVQEYYRPCVVQQPMLIQHIEKEIRDNLHETVAGCFDSLEESYAGKGYSVEIRTGNEATKLLPNRIVSTYNYTFDITKGEDVQNYNSFVVTVNNNLYELASIANSIIGMESVYGDTDPEIYMTYYPDFKVERILRDSGEKIYILTDRTTKDKFRFAIRSQVWPGGFVNATA